MSMVKYGSFSFLANECNLVRVERNNIFSQRNRRLIGINRHTLEIVVKKDTAAELTTRINEIYTAFNTNYQDYGLYTDDAGTILSSHYLTNSDSLSGVRVVNGPKFQDSDGAEYANKRTIIITLEATYDNSDSDLVSWRESLRFVGNCAQDYVVMSGYPAPVVFPMGNTTHQVIIQTGEAVGFAAPVAPPGPIFTVGVYRPPLDQEEGYDSGVNQGNGYYRFYPSHWRYVMIALTPQIGYPTTR